MGRAQRPNPVLIARAGPASGLAAAHPGPSAPDGRRRTAVLGVRAQGSGCTRTYKGEAGRPACALAAPHRHALRRLAAGTPSPWWPSHRRRPFEIRPHPFTSNRGEHFPATLSSSSSYPASRRAPSLPERRRFGRTGYLPPVCS
jgi:hypothetical protein